MKQDNSKKISIIIISITVVLLGAMGFFTYMTIQSHSDIKKQMDLGEKYLSEGDYEEAIEAFKRVIEIDSKYENAYLGLATAYANEENYDEAIKCLNQLAGFSESEEVLNTAKVLVNEYQEKMNEIVNPSVCPDITDNPKGPEEPVTTEVPVISRLANRQEEIKKTITDRFDYIDANDDWGYTYYKEGDLMLVRIGNDYAYNLVACIAEADYIYAAYLGNERSQVYVLPEEGIIVSISANGANEEEYAIYHFGDDGEYGCFLEMDIKIVATGSEDSSNVNYSIMAEGGEYIGGEPCSNGKELLDKYSRNFLTTVNGFPWANTEDNRCDWESADNYYVGTDFDQAFNK